MSGLTERWVPMRQEETIHLLELAVLVVALVIVIVMACWTGKC